MKSGEFFRTAKRSGLWPEAEAVHHSAFTRARKKVSWHVLRDILKDAVLLAYEVWPQDARFTWHGMSVFAFDGSKYTLPATKEIRNAFDPNSGLQYPGKGHYPQCLVTTAYDVFRRIAIARPFPAILPNAMTVFAPLKGYCSSPGYEFLRLMRRFRGHLRFSMSSAQ